MHRPHSQVRTRRRLPKPMLWQARTLLRLPRPMPLTARQLLRVLRLQLQQRLLRPPIVLRLLYQVKTLPRLLRLTRLLVKTQLRLLRPLPAPKQAKQPLPRLQPVPRQGKLQLLRLRLSKVRVMQGLLPPRPITVRSRHSRVRPLLPLIRLQQQLKHQKLLAVLRLH